MFEEHLLTHGVTADQIISINFEDFDFAHLTNPQNLYAYIKERLQSDRQNYLFLDEIQNVADFQKVVDSIFLKDVVARKKITDVMMLERVIRFMADNIGNELSTKKISDTMI